MAQTPDMSKSPHSEMEVEKLATKEIGDCKYWGCTEDHQSNPLPLPKKRRRNMNCKKNKAKFKLTQVEHAVDKAWERFK